jgi:sugar/nucleoside kinase (ribokinase family)
VISVEERARTIAELEAHNLQVSWNCFALLCFERYDKIERIELSGSHVCVSEGERICCVQLNAGGSLANTLSGMATLAKAAHETDPNMVPASRIGMAGCIGSDALGTYFQQQLASSGVEWVGAPLPGTTTGTVVVLTTPDAQRSFLSLPGSGRLHMCPDVSTGLACARVTVIEGYLWQMPDAAERIFQAIALARAAGSIVALTAADVSIVKRHRTVMLQAAAAADLLFGNAEEARALVDAGIDDVSYSHTEVPADEVAQTCNRPEAEQDCLQLGRICPMVVVTRGSRGSCIAALGQLNVVPPHWSENAPVDTCGAGDAYAAGFLHAYLRGSNVRQMGEFGAWCASSVLGRQGPKLLEEDALSLVSLLQARSQGAMSAV